MKLIIADLIRMQALTRSYKASKCLIHAIGLVMPYKALQSLRKAAVQGYKHAVGNLERYIAAMHG